MPMRITYLLRHWGGYERNRDYLRSNERRNATILYTALSKLTADEFKLLANKYRTGVLSGEDPKTGIHLTDTPMPDAEQAKQYGLTVSGMRQARAKVEKKLNRLALAAIDDIDIKAGAKLEQFKLYRDGLYIQSFSKYSGTVMTLTSNKKLAKVWHKADDAVQDGYRLIELLYHFKRVAVDDNNLLS